MPSFPDLNYSPHKSQGEKRLSSASNVILIDNYDSFTWNIYQYLVIEGATVTVYRNDEITLAELVDLKPTQLIISPGPGHPITDAGISIDAIRRFSGEIPILGVCMGEQCIFSAFGGWVEVTGEILHGKTSPLRHDSKWLYAGLAQDLQVTRYHSLAGTHSSLPDCLEITSWISDGPDGGKGIIMGVRHREYVIEGVQFHPESILTVAGRCMLRNFLRLKGGTWDKNEYLMKKSAASPEADGSKGDYRTARTLTSNGCPPVKPDESKESILTRIYEHRKRALKSQTLIPSQSQVDLQALYNLSVSPPSISFPDRLRISPFSISLMAEIKRASPSKGIISLDTNTATQARKYALAGASVISVLTEPEWFKGSIDDLRWARRSIEAMPNRPAILRKDFVFDEYQILEARLAGADTILLIVKMLEKDLLTRLYRYSQSLGMEPLVEVNTIEEMDIAIELGAEVIGVNNRNLTSFEVDLNTTTRLIEKVSRKTLICALSGISSRDDIQSYKGSGVKAVLIGEALMRATNPRTFVEELLDQSDNVSPKVREFRPLVKICGTRTPEIARAAIEAGADLIGIILVEGRKRSVSQKIALEISEVVHGTQKSRRYSNLRQSMRPSLQAIDWFEHSSTLLEQASRALLVGVFQNQPFSYILAQQQLLDLDVVQLHGSEPTEWASIIPVPVICRFDSQNLGMGQRGYHALPLLDSPVGGTGQKLELSSIQKTLAADEGLRIVLAGGLEPTNVKDTLKHLGQQASQVAAVDVSSGIEEDGIQNLQKIREFIQAAKFG